MKTRFICNCLTGIFLGYYGLHLAPAQAQEFIQKTEINVPNGVAGLNDDGDITQEISNQNINTQNINSQNLNNQNINTQNINTQNMIAQHIGSQFFTIIGNGQLRFSVSDNISDNQDITIFYNKEDTIDEEQHHLTANTLYFTNNHEGNHYHFQGDVVARKYTGELSTPTSSSASCNPGEFQDDANYHYVCIAPNKWKRVALSDF